MNQQAGQSAHGLSAVTLDSDDAGLGASMGDPGSMARLSALCDGELNEADAQATIIEVLGDPNLKAAWHRYHAVGDGLRSDELITPGNAEAVQMRFAAALSAEPVVLAPHARRWASRWPRWIGHGLTAAAGAAAMLMMSLFSPLQSQPAPVVAKVGASSNTQASVDTVKLYEYLSAHQEFSTASWRGANRILPAALMIQSTSVDSTKK